MGHNRSFALGRADIVAPARLASFADEGSRAIDRVMERYATGDDSALEELYRRAGPRLLSFLARLCADLTLAEDLTQDAFLRVGGARGTFVSGAPALPWMFAIARNAFRDHVRREDVRRSHRTASVDGRLAVAREAPADSGERLAMARQRLGHVQAALMTLPVRQREAFVMMRFGGLSVAETAQAIGATEAAVKLLVFRAYTAVREKLEERARHEALSAPSSERAFSLSRRKTG